MVEALPEYVEKENPLALIEAWNEWGEGTVIEPGKQYGFNHLSSILSALAVVPPEWSRCSSTMRRMPSVSMPSANGRTA
jgi:hypothetical protein